MHLDDLALRQSIAVFKDQLPQESLQRIVDVQRQQKLLPAEFCTARRRRKDAFVQGKLPFGRRQREENLGQAAPHLPANIFELLRLFVPVGLESRHVRSKDLGRHLLLLRQIDHRAERSGQPDIVEKTLQKIISGVVRAAAAHLATPARLEAGRGRLLDLAQLLQPVRQVRVPESFKGVQPRTRSHLQARKPQQQLGSRNPQVLLPSRAPGHNLPVFVQICHISAVVLP